MEKQYYQEYYVQERKHWWFLVRSRIIAAFASRYIYKGTPLKILNIGVATGATSEMLQRFGEVTSVEFEQSCVDFVREKVGIQVQQGSILELDFPDSTFDLVCAFDVIEHVEDDKLAASEMRRVTKSGGYMYTTVPAFMMMWSKHDEVNHHYRRYTASKFNNLFSGSTPVKRTYFNSLLFPLILVFRVLGRMLPKKKSTEGTGSDFEASNPLIDKIFYTIFQLEYHLLKLGIPFTVGVSYLSIHQKK